MTAQMASYLDAIERLPTGGILILTDVSWLEYEQLLTSLGDSNAVRVGYNEGRLEVMSPSLGHERYKELILLIANLIAQEMDLDFESGGSTTLKKRELAQGAEPDTCFYVQNATSIIGKKRFDLSTDLPPDVIVEIDVSHESRDKFDFYAILGVPEIWLYNERMAQIYCLTEGQYIEMASSRAFPLLTSEALTRFLEQSKTEGQSAALRSCREWLRSQQMESA